MAEEDEQLRQLYQQKSDKQHVLDAPDTWTGSMELTEYDTFIYREDATASAADAETLLPRIVNKQLTIIPGLYKLFDEAMVNCSDHKIRMQQLIEKEASSSSLVPVTQISVSISTEIENCLTFTNNGNGIDVAKHPDLTNLWIPELIFANLRTSTNYDKEQKKITGGKNGFGVKLVFIWSSWGRIETVDHIRGLKYVQEFENNLEIIHPPKITKCKSAPYTTISFRPDYARLGLKDKGLSADMLSLFKRRVFDIAAMVGKSVKVSFNNTPVPVKTFAQYVDLYLPPSSADTNNNNNNHKVFHEIDATGRWEYAVCLTTKDEFTHVSFVNGIFTGKGGKHVDYILNQIVRKLAAYIKLKRKIDVKLATIKEQLNLFLRCDIENPTFESQTKDYLNTPPNKFGSTCEVSDKFVEKIAKMGGVMDAACALTEVKEMKSNKKNDGVKTRHVRGIAKLTDANEAGGANSSKCVLILCEGDSAKAGILSGLSSADRNYYGIYALRGKLFNVRGETAKRVSEVREVHDIKQCMGLEAGKTYTAEDAKKKLRYGKVLIMTDQDLDGSHIKGLCINLFDSEWTSLLDIPGFLGFMNTPIIRAQKGKTLDKLFYNDGEYATWKAATEGGKGWHVKYYKGLGTSTATEFKAYFAEKRLISFTSTGIASRDAIDMAFNKKRAPDRKEWLGRYNPALYLDTNIDLVPYEKFINEELVHFSQKDCERSIPNLLDGLKTSQRKILYTCFLRRLMAAEGEDPNRKEIKVAQLSGSVAEISRYHHGEQSLCEAIIGMAQEFVGSNNIPLLLANGQFGTRLQGGNDSASPRYVCTLLSRLTRFIYPAADDKVLTYLEDDGAAVEPKHYIPIIPMLLVNGAKGIGTGFSTEVLCYNPLQIIDYLLRLRGPVSPIRGHPVSPVIEQSAENSLSTPEISNAPEVFLPYYHGFKGTVRALSAERFLFKGVYEIISDKQIRITELPIGLWTDDYKQFLEDLMDDVVVVAKKKDKTEEVDEKQKTKEKSEASKKVLPLIKEYIDMSTDRDIDIKITFHTAETLVTMQQNMSADEGCTQLEKYLKLYTIKTNTNMHAFDQDEKLLKFKSVQEVIDHFVKVRRHYYNLRKEEQLKTLTATLLILQNKVRFINELLANTIDLRHKSKSEIQILLETHNYYKGDDDNDQSFKYLIEMPMNSVTAERVTTLVNECNAKEKEVAYLQTTSIDDIWLNELNILRREYLTFLKATTEDKAKSTEVKVKSTKKSISANAKSICK